MSIIVTGGAGFIGSCVIAELNKMGYEDIVIVDNIAETEKWRNIENKIFSQYIHKQRFLQELPSFDGKVSHVIHMGACSATTEKNFDYLYQNNFEFSCALWEFCVRNQISFIYASSAATYGDGQAGFDDEQDIRNLRPLNGYGYSKQLFDLWSEKQKELPLQHVGLKFFNVYGPNEYWKGAMASVIFHSFHQIKETGKVKLFKSYRKEYQDGGQLRDFVYVKDICKVITFFMQNPDKSGIFNVGTGRAESFNVLAESVFKAMDLAPDIEYTDMPATLQPKYQYYTKAEIRKLRKAGYQEDFYTLEQGTADYVRNYLLKGNRIW